MQGSYIIRALGATFIGAVAGFFAQHNGMADWKIYAVIFLTGAGVYFLTTGRWN